MGVIWSMRIPGRWGTVAGPTEAFYRANYARLVGQMVPVVGDVHEAEDVVQEAFARASLHWSRVRGYHADAWVRRVALNYARSGLRRASYRRRVVER